MNFHQIIDQRAAQAQEQLHTLSQRYRDEITNKVGFWIRSDAQKRRYRMAQQLQEIKTK